MVAVTDVEALMIRARLGPFSCGYCLSRVWWWGEEGGTARCLVVVVSALFLPCSTQSDKPLARKFPRWTFDYLKIGNEEMM